VSDLSEAKVGDSLLIKRWRMPDEIEEVVRVTATQVVGSSRRFKKSNGCRIGGDSWTHITATLATPREIQTVREMQESRTTRRVIVEMLENSRRRWTASTLKQVKQLLEDGEMKSESDGAQ